MDYDTLIVGAGAAGIGAGRALQAAGRSFLILEARSRVGGRTFTESSSFGFPVDHGGQYLHSGDINPLVPLARAAGFHVSDRSEDWSANNGRPLLDESGFRDFERAFGAFFDSLDTFDLRGPDRAVSALLPDSRWRTLIHAVMTFISGAHPSRLSSSDLAAAINTYIDLPIREGMGTLVTQLARGLPIRTNTPVTAIDWSQTPVRVSTPAGTLRCKHLLLTVPTNVIAAGSVTFTPALPVTKQEAMEQLPQGLNEKVFVPLREPAPPECNDVYVYSSVSSEDACHMQMQPFGQPCVMGYFGADAAGEVARMGAAGATDVMRSAVANVYGNDLAKCVDPGVVTQWCTDPYSQGAYSYAKPGKRAARDALAEPVADRLFFAGEATYAEHYGTVHGAFMSGELCAASLPA